MLLIHSIFLEKLELCLSGGQVEIFHYWGKKKEESFLAFLKREGEKPLRLVFKYSTINFTTKSLLGRYPAPS